MSIGNYAVQSGQYFQGDIDEVQVWRTARSAADIQASMCRKFITAPADLVAYYRLDQSNGLVAVDEGSQPTNGSLISFAGTPWHLSGAPLGNASANLYQSTWATGSKVALATATGDSAVVSGLPAQARGVQVYTVNSAPSIAAGAGAASSYVGVFSAGTVPALAYTLRLHPRGGPACQSVRQRPANDSPWAALATTSTATSFVANALSYRGEYILVGAAPPPLTISGDSVLCAGATGQLTASAAGAMAYRWNTGATTPTLVVGQAGLYTVTVTLPGCPQPVQASYRVRAETAVPPFSLGADTTLCEGDRLVLRAPAGRGLRYQWSDGSTGPQLTALTAGTYTLRVSNACGSGQATRVVGARNCLKIPNIITPNNDTHNDFFTVEGLRGNDWSLDVYNRWGAIVLHTTSYHNDWGTGATPGIYYVLLRRAATGYSYKGWVEVVR